MPQLISAKKKKYVETFRTPRIRGTVLVSNAGVSSRYHARLKKLIARMISEAQVEIRKLYKEDHATEYFAMDDTISAQAKILLNSLERKFDSMFSAHAKRISEFLVSESDESSESALKMSLKELSGGLTIKTDILGNELKEVLSAATAENVSLIKSIPSEYFTRIQGSVMRSITTGNGLADLVPAMKRYKQITEKRARLIATDQTRKLFSDINRVRMTKLGIAKFEWLHSSGSQHPRKLHQDLSGQIFRMDAPPVIDAKTGQRGFPGQLINCLCKMIPVIEFND